MRTVISKQYASSTLNAELNPVCHLLAILGAHHIFHVSGLRVKNFLLSSDHEKSQTLTTVLFPSVTVRFLHMTLFYALTDHN